MGLATYCMRSHPPIFAPSCSPLTDSSRKYGIKIFNGTTLSPVRFQDPSSHQTRSSTARSLHSDSHGCPSPSEDCSPSRSNVDLWMATTDAARDGREPETPDSIESWTVSSLPIHIRLPCDTRGSPITYTTPFAFPHPSVSQPRPHPMVGTCRQPGPPPPWPRPRPSGPERFIARPVADPCLSDWHLGTRSERQDG